MFIYTICCRHHRKWVEIRLRYTLQRNILISMNFLAKHMHGNFLLCLYLYMWRFYVSIFFSDGQQVYVFFTGSEKEHCIDSHVLYLDLEMTLFFVYDQFSVQNKKRNCYFSLFPWRCKDGP